MLRRFMAASAIAAVGIGCAVSILLLVPIPLSRSYPIVCLWCYAPLAWGIWAMLTPAQWLPERLPLWGACLGFLGGTLVMFVLNMPARIFGEPVPAVARTLGVMVLTLAYYLLWMLVRVAYRALAPAPQPQPEMVHAG